MNSLLVGAGCFSTHVVVTLVWLRLPGRTSPVVRHAASAVVTHAVVIAVASLFVPVAYWPAAAVAGFGAVCWLFVFSAVYKSVSLRILTELSRAPGHAIPVETITDDYVRPEFEGRTEILRKMGCADADGGTFRVTEKGESTAGRIRAVQRVCGIEASGLYGEGEPQPRPEAASSL